VKTLLVTADDFARHPVVDRAVRRGFDQGLVTGAAVLVNSSRLGAAVRLARREPPLPCGLHLTLTEGRPCLPPEQVPSLVDPRGQFLSPLGFFARWLRGGIRTMEVRREWAAQFDLFERWLGPAVSLSSHHHIHLLPGLWEPAGELAARRGVAWVRPTLEVVHPGRGSLGTISRLRDLLSPEGGKSAAFRLVDPLRRGRPLGAWEAAGAGPTGFIRLRPLPGLSTPESLRRLLLCLPAGTFELVCHPVLHERRLPWARGHGGELAALCDPGTERLCRRLGISLLSPAEAGAPRAAGHGGRGP